MKTEIIRGFKGKKFFILKDSISGHWFCNCNAKIHTAPTALRAFKGWLFMYEDQK
jgi:hypothetical protein